MSSFPRGSWQLWLTLTLVTGTLAILSVIGLAQFSVGVDSPMRGQQCKDSPAKCCDVSYDNQTAMVVGRCQVQSTARRLPVDCGTGRLLFCINADGQTTLAPVVDLKLVITLSALGTTIMAVLAVVFGVLLCCKL